jgi:predicted transcriptional regulator
MPRTNRNYKFRFTLRMKEDEYKTLQEIAEQEDMTPSSLTRKAIKREISEYKNKFTHDMGAQLPQGERS